jgi:hypothetical protein
MAPITHDDVFFLLEPLVGLPLLLLHSELPQDITELLRAYDWQGKVSLDQLKASLESALFNGIYTYTGGRMMVEDTLGNAHKIHTDQLAQMAETLLEPVFARLPRTQAAYELLNDYALRHLSLPALKQLYLGYADRLPPQNHAIFTRIITENFPKEAYNAWLKA